MATVKGHPLQPKVRAVQVTIFIDAAAADLRLSQGLQSHSPHVHVPTPRPRSLQAAATPLHSAASQPPRSLHAAPTLP